MIHGPINNNQTSSEVNYYELAHDCSYFINFDLIASYLASEEMLPSFKMGVLLMYTYIIPLACPFYRKRVKKGPGIIIILKSVHALKSSVTILGVR